MAVVRIINVGLDMSLRSPACCIHDGKTLHVFAFARTKKQKNLVFKRDGVQIDLLSPLQSSSTSDLMRYKEITDRLLEQKVFTLLQKFEADVEIRVGVEGYVFSKGQHGHTYKLHELTGYVKMLFLKYVKSPEFIVSIPVTRWKKKLTQKSFATKYEVYKAVIDFIKTPFLASGLKEGLITPLSHVPNPLQDICDSIGIVHFMIGSGTTWPPPLLNANTKTKGIKRKRTKRGS